MAVAPQAIILVFYDHRKESLSKYFWRRRNADKLACNHFPIMFAPTYGSLKLAVLFKAPICLATLWEKKKMLVISIIFFLHNVFYPKKEKDRLQHLSLIKIIVCKYFLFGTKPKFCLLVLFHICLHLSNELSIFDLGLLRQVEISELQYYNKFSRQTA